MFGVLDEDEVQDALRRLPQALELAALELREDRYRVDEGPNAARKRARDTMALLNNKTLLSTGIPTANKTRLIRSDKEGQFPIKGTRSRTKRICPVTAPHGRGESHATVLCGAYFT